MNLNNYKLVKENIYKYNPNATLIAVTKNINIENIIKTYELGIFNIAESYIKEALNKYSLLNKFNFNWHFIGPLQTNKIKDLANKFTYIHSVYKTKHIDEILKRYDSKVNIFLEYNTTNELNKSGLKNEAELFNLIEYYISLKQYKINLLGLMTMAAFSNNSKHSIPYFLNLKNLQEKVNKNYNLNLSAYSMGMSNDYIEALKLGATHIRIGTLLYE